jgi:anti-sigma factor RsiW
MSESRDHITCQELVERASDYLEGALSADDAELLEHHLNYCQGCEWYLDEMRRTIAMGTRLREEQVAEETLERLVAAFTDRRPS